MKNPVFAFLAVVAIALSACTDYLEEFDDKYEDRYTSEEVSSNDSQDTELSSEAHSPSSSSESETKEESSSSETGTEIDSSTSSSSPTESSSSVVSSSSIASSSSVKATSSSSVTSSSSSVASSSSVKATSSSSVATSSSSSAISSSSVASSSSIQCTGTVLFGEGKTFFDPNEDPYLGETPLNFSNSNYFYSTLGSNFEDYVNVSSWDGLCIEYESNISFTASLMRVSSIQTQKYATEVYFKLESTDNSVNTKELYWENSGLAETASVYKAILSAVNILKIETGTKNEGKATIHKITAIPSSSISSTSTFTAEKGSLKQEWVIDGKGPHTYSEAKNKCPENSKLPSLEDVKNLAKILENKEVINGGEAIQYIYSILIGDKDINSQSYMLDGNTIKNTYAFWTSEDYLVYVFKSSTGTKNINWKKPEDPENTQAMVHCIMDSN